MIDVVYILGTKSIWNDNEIRFSLRSVEKHLLGKYQVWIIGYKPDWIKNVIYVSSIDSFRLGPKNVNYKLHLYSKISSNPFILMNDDFFFSDDIAVSGIPLLYNGTIKQRIDSLGGNNIYRKILSTTRKKLKSGLNFELHTPMPVFDRTTFDKLFKEDYYFNIRSMYGNLTNLDKSEINKDVKLFDAPRKTPKPFFSVGDGFFTDKGKKFLADMFPYKSKYEIYTSLSA